MENVNLCLLECANKVFKKFRLEHARTCNREANMRDVFTRMIQISDPLTLHSQINKNLNYAEKKPFPKEVLDLLVPTQPPNFSLWKDNYDPTMDTVSSFCKSIQK